MDNDTVKYPGYNQPFLVEEESINFKRYLSFFISNWYWFAVSLFIALTLSYGINRYSEEVYAVSSTLLIQNDQLNETSSGMSSIIPGGDIFSSAQNLKNELGILTSFSLNCRVISELPEFNITYVAVGRRGIAETKLYNRCPFVIVYDSIELQPKNHQVKIDLLSRDSVLLEIDDNLNHSERLKYGDRFNKFGFDFYITKKDSNQVIPEDYPKKYYFFFESSESIANQYRNRLEIAPIDEGASLVRLSVTGFVAAQEADYLNKLMELYIQQGLENKRTTADSTIVFINKQLNIIADSLSVAEEKLEKFRLTNRILDLSREGSLIQNRLEGFETQKFNYVLQQKYYDYLTKYLNTRNESGEIISPSVVGIEDPVLIGLVESLSQTQLKKKKLDFNISGKVPALSYVDSEIENARNALLENIRNGKESLNLAIADINESISAIDEEMTKLPGTERMLIKIQRKFDLNNSVYTYLLEKRAEAGIAMASTVSKNRIIDKASTFNSSVIKPKKKQNNAMAIIFGLIIPGIFILLLDYFNNKIIDKHDVEKRTKAPIIGYISHNDNKNEIPVISKPGSTLAESFRSVRTSLKYYTRDSESFIVSITSTISSEGKTFISVNLASIVALLGKKVLIVGLDLRKPKIHRVFNIDNAEGLSTYLSGNSQYEDIIKETSVKNLYCTPSGEIPPNPAELIESEKMKIFFERVRKDFDFIILDTPPIAVVTDAMLLTRFVDMNIFVVRQRYTSKNTLDLIDELYHGGKFKNLAIIINDINLSGYYGYGLRYGYSIGSGYNYGYNYYSQYGKYGYSDAAKGYYREDT